MVQVLLHKKQNPEADRDFVHCYGKWSKSFVCKSHIVQICWWYHILLLFIFSIILFIVL